MNLDAYHYKTNEGYMDYEFHSEGPKGDRDKILATVAATVLEFTGHSPDIPVYATGSTPSRTRLYQIGIAASWNEIEPLLYVYGYTGDRWGSFQKGINYEGFMVLRKKM